MVLPRTTARHLPEIPSQVALNASITKPDAIGSSNLITAGAKLEADNFPACS
jgi:hypothetical protein